MYIDASVIVAILKNESCADTLLAKVEEGRKPIFYSSITL